MEDRKLQALHDTLSKLRGRQGLGTSSLYSWQRNASHQGVAGDPPPSGGNPLHVHFHREGEHPHRALARGDGDGRVIKRNFNDVEDSLPSSSLGDVGDRKREKERRKKKAKRDDEGDKKQTKEEKKAALKAAKLELKRQAKLEEKRRDKRAAKAKQAPPPLASPKVDDETATSGVLSATDASKVKSSTKDKKKRSKKETKRPRTEMQCAGESSSPKAVLEKASEGIASKQKKKRKASR